ncbi:MAG: malonyl-CoA synthase [Gammaproteobacteria bacterium]|nr:malonyl-CoA synthase [Gammaproteobacteria bacterium]
MSNHLIDRLLAPRAGSARPLLALPAGAALFYGAFGARVNQVARLLTDRGVGPGDRVAAQVPKSWQTLALYLGTIKAGGVFLPLNTAYTAKEVGYFVRDAEPMILVCDPGDAGELEPLMASRDADPGGGSLLTLDAAGRGSLADGADTRDTEFDAVPRSPGDLAAILYTSGTTGRAKGAMLTHDNLWSNAEALTDCWRFTVDDVLLHALPVFHTHGLFVATNVLMVAGGRMIFLPGFRIDEIIHCLSRATSMMGVPTFYTRLLQDPRLDHGLVRHVRLFVSGSAPLLAETHDAFWERTGHRILERYGMTETGMNTSNPYEGERRAGTVGPALPGVNVRVVDEQGGETAPAGEIGRVEVRGPNVFPGYWRMPEKTREEFTADGFFITGDLGMLGEDGYLTIVGRSKDLIISGGYNVYPKEIELVLDALPGVGESAIIGVPHPDFGEGVVAVLTGDAPPDEERVRELVSGQLARFKQPRRVFHVDALPRNSMGKVQKNLLREQYADAFAAE